MKTLLQLLSLSVLAAGLFVDPGIVPAPVAAHESPANPVVAQESPAVSDKAPPALHPVAVLPPATPPRLFRIRGRGWMLAGGQRRATFAEAGGFAVSVRQILTVAHLLDDFDLTRGRPGIDVEIDGVWHNSLPWRAIPGRDWLLVTIPPSAGDLSPAPTAPLTYGETLHCIGLKSPRIQTGIAANFNRRTALTAQLSLEAAAAGIVPGDSGGAVFNPCGEIVGIITARNPDQPQVVTVEPLATEGFPALADILTPRDPDPAHSPPPALAPFRLQSPDPLAPDCPNCQRPPLRLR